MGYIVSYQLVRGHLLDDGERKTLAEHLGAFRLSRSSEPYGLCCAEVPNAHRQIAFGSTELGSRGTRDLLALLVVPREAPAI